MGLITFDNYEEWDLNKKRSKMLGKGIDDDGLIFTPKFKSYLIGNHKKNGFFRVTITLEHDLKDYEITIKNNKASIKYKK